MGMVMRVVQLVVPAEREEEGWEEEGSQEEEGVAKIYRYNHRPPTVNVNR